MSYEANDNWNTWESWGAGATVTVVDGVLRIQDASTSTNGSRYFHATARAGDLIRFDVTARAISGQGRLWINLVGVGTVQTNDVLVKDSSEFRRYSVEYVIPNTYSLVGVFIGFGCTTPEIGDVEAFSPSVYINGSQINLPHAVSNIDVNSSKPALTISQLGSGPALLVEDEASDATPTVITASGSLGLGTPTPIFKLHVSGDAGNPAAGFDHFTDGNGGSAVVFRKGRGSAQAPSAVLQNDYLGSFLCRGQGETAMGSANIGLIGLRAAENFTNSAQGVYFVIEVAAAGGTARTERLRIESAGHATPGVDAAQTLGSAGRRWSTVFASTGTINTSDAREKQQIRPVSEAERAVALRLKSMIRAFKWNDAVEQKCDDARIHFGVIAQEVKAAFEAEGLDALKYGALCYDEWEDQYEPVMSTREIKGRDGQVVTEEYDTGEKRLVRAAGSRYGVRHDQLFALIISAL